MRMILEDRLVELFEEIHRLEVARVAVFVRLPLAVPAPIVEVQHVRDRVDAQPVDVELLEPKERVRNEEALHLRPPVVKIGRAPLAVLRARLVVGLVEVLTVKPAKPLFVLAKMPRNPIHDDADAVLMRSVDEIAEIVRRAVAARHGEIARRLIAPRAVVWMLAERHEFDVCVVHILDIADQLIRHLTIGEVFAFERTPP